MNSIDYKTLTENQILNNWDTLDLKSIARYCKISEQFIETNWKKFIPERAALFCYQQFSEEFLRRNQNKFTRYDWLWISKWQKVSEEFIREFIDYVSIPSYVLQHYSIDFIREFRDKVDWRIISQEIDDQLMFEYQDEKGNYDQRFIKEFDEQMRKYIE